MAASAAVIALIAAGATPAVAADAPGQDKAGHYSFAIIGDIFRDKTLSGVGKAVWLFFLIFVPFLTALIYLIARGDGMAQRNVRDAADAKQATDEYIRSVATSSPSDEIAKAKSLLDAGTINQAEYEAIKTKALSA